MSPWSRGRRRSSGHLVSTESLSRSPATSHRRLLLEKPVTQVDDTAQGAGQGPHTWIPEAKRYGYLAFPVVGLKESCSDKNASPTQVYGRACDTVKRALERHVCELRAWTKRPTCFAPSSRTTCGRAAAARVPLPTPQPSIAKWSSR